MNATKFLQSLKFWFKFQIAVIIMAFLSKIFIFFFNFKSILIRATQGCSQDVRDIEVIRPQIHHLERIQTRHKKGKLLLQYEFHTYKKEEPVLITGSDV